MAVDAEQHEPLWRRHLGVLIVGGFAVVLVVIVLLQVLEEGDVAAWLAEAPEEWAYLLCFGLVWLDAVIPIFPGETTLSAASTLAAAWNPRAASSSWRLGRSARSSETRRFSGSPARAPPECKTNSTPR